MSTKDTYISATCSVLKKKYLGSAVIFCLFPTFGTQIEVYIFKNTVFVLESSLQDWPDYICHHSLASVPMQVSAAITSPLDPTCL